MGNVYQFANCYCTGESSCKNWCPNQNNVNYLKGNLTNVEDTIENLSACGSCSDIVKGKCTLPGYLDSLQKNLINDYCNVIYFIDDNINSVVDAANSCTCNNSQEKSGSARAVGAGVSCGLAVLLSTL